jgi:predicted nucleic acid-binding protein
VLLVDTGIWIDFLRRGDARLERSLLAGQVLGHVLITGELAMGSLGDRAAVLGLLRALPQAERARDDEVIALVERQRLFSLGLGFIDAHLLAATLLTPETRLWTGDRRLRDAAERLGVAAEEG